MTMLNTIMGLKKSVAEMGGFTETRTVEVSDAAVQLAEMGIEDLAVMTKVLSHAGEDSMDPKIRDDLLELAARGAVYIGALLSEVDPSAFEAMGRIEDPQDRVLRPREETVRRREV